MLLEVFWTWTNLLTIAWESVFRARDQFIKPYLKMTNVCLPSVVNTVSNVFVCKKSNNNMRMYYLSCLILIRVIS